MRTPIGPTSTTATPTERPEASSMHEANRSFIPAAGRDWLLPLYDPLTRLMGAEGLRRQLVLRAGLRPGDRVLDLGCGTGSLAVAAKRLQPAAQVVGIDPDPKALRRARARALRAGLEIGFEEGFGDALPFAGGAFDRIVSSLVLHHLTLEEKRATLRECARVLAPEGTLHVLDFAAPRDGLDRLLAHVFHRGENLRDNFSGTIPELLRGAGLAEVEETAGPRTPFGRVGTISGRRPAAAHSTTGAPV
jgi:SAM-dependent methyltransferase